MITLSYLIRKRVKWGNYKCYSIRMDVQKKRLFQVWSEKIFSFFAYNQYCSFALNLSQINVIVMIMYGRYKIALTFTIDNNINELIWRF